LALYGWNSCPLALPAWHAHAKETVSFIATVPSAVNYVPKVRRGQGKNNRLLRLLSFSILN
jgi:hypothetical protein